MKLVINPVEAAADLPDFIHDSLAQDSIFIAMFFTHILFSNFKCE